MPSHPLLVQLRSREALEDVVDSAGTELERVLALRKWASRQWKFGNPDPYPPWNALEILDWIRSGRTSGHCGQYAMVFLQACLSFAIQARYIEIGNRSNPCSHFTTEVWLSEFGKWVVVDATAASNFAPYYLRQGLPQSGLELHDALLSGEAESVEVVRDAETQGGGQGKRAQTSLDNYHYLRVFFRQDQAVNPPRFADPNDTADRFKDAVEWEDGKTLPWEKSPLRGPIPNRRLTRRRTGDLRDLYWSPLS
jgi:hypothetical protein